MHMQTVPNSLMGASLGEAHKWVREQMVHSNPGKPMADYTLTDENGKRINLSDLTRGKASHVTINAAGSVRSNPAHPAEIRGFMEVPQPMHANRLTALTQNQITPALYNAMVNEFGLFGATQTLSILLTRPVSPSLRHTPKTANLIRARKGESLLPLLRVKPKTKLEKKKQEKKDNNKGKQRNSRGGKGGRNNPRSNPTPAEATSAATALGLGASVPAAASRLGRAGMLNLDLDKTTTEVRREIDAMLDDAEDEFALGEAGALVSVANRMSLKYENSEAIFQNFAQNVLAPYLITSTANINALKYINEYILPAMREIVGNKEQSKRKLDRQYKYLVNKLATDPKDFYMGTELALIAHPAFLFPRAGLALMPVPETTRDMAFKAFTQVGTPPKWDPGTGFVMVADKSDQSGVAYLDQTTFTGRGGINNQSFQRGRNLARVMEMIDNFTEAIERYGTTDSSGFNVLTRDTRSMARMAGNELYESLAWADDQRKPAFYFVDLPGIRPIPTNWPQNLIMALMETLGANRERITGLGGPFNANDFLTPSGINLTADTEFGHPDFPTFTAWMNEFNRLQGVGADVNIGNSENAAAEKLITALSAVANKNGTPLILDDQLAGPGHITSPLSTSQPRIAAPPILHVQRLDLQQDLGAITALGGEAAQVIWGAAVGGVSTPIEVYRTLSDFLDHIIDQNRATSGPIAGPGIPNAGFTVNYEDLINEPAFTMYLATAIGQMSPLEPITAQSRSASPSVYQIMVDAVELSMRKYQYNPSKDDIYFTTVLLYYSLRNMGLDAEVSTFMTGISGFLERARNRSLAQFRADVAADYPIGGAVLPPAQMNNYLALRFIYEAFNDPNSEAFRQLTGVRVNPAPPVVTEANITGIKETLKKSIAEFEKEIARTGKGTQAEAVYDAMEKLLTPSIVKQIQSGNTDPLFTYVGKRAQPTEKIIESVNTLFGECQDSVKEHLIALSELSGALSGNLNPPGRTKASTFITQKLEAVKGTSSQLELLDDMATAMDDFMKYLPKEVTKVERAYVSKIKDFMTIIGDDLQFDKETVSDLIKEVNQNTDDIDNKNKIPYAVLSTLIVEMKEMQDVVIAIDATIKPFEAYNMSSRSSTTRYSNFAKRVGGSPDFTTLKKELIGSYSELLVAVSSMCGSTTDTETMLSGYINAKQDIETVDTMTGILQPNPFESFVRSKDSTVLAQALHKTGDLSIGSRADYENLFEGQVAYGQTLLDYFAEISEDTGIESQGQFKMNKGSNMSALIDGLYKKYERRVKAGNTVKRIAGGSFHLISDLTLGTIGGTTMAATTALGAAGMGIVGGVELAQTGIQSVVNIGQVTREAMNQSTQTVLESMRTAGVLTREKLRKMQTKAVEETKTSIAAIKDDAAALRDFIKAQGVVRGTQTLEWTKRRMTDARMKTYEALAAYENGTTWGVVESGAVAVGSMLMSFDLARERRRTQKNIDNNIKTIQENIKDITKLKKAYSEIPTQHSGMLKDSVLYLNELLEELTRKGEQQMVRLKSMDENMPNSVFEDLGRGARAIGHEVNKMADLVIDGVIAGASIAKAAAATTTEVALDLAVTGVKTSAGALAKATEIGARGGLAALSFGASEVLPAMNRAEEANRLQMIGEAMKKETMGKPLSQLEQQALDGHRRRQGQ
jgi:hypothetical protein